MINTIDLHVHSNASDGTLTPREVIELAYHKKLSAIALTDHDTVQGIPEALFTAERLSSLEQPFRLIPGTEISAGYQNKEIHILGLLIDEKCPQLLKTLDGLASEREDRNKQMIQNLVSDGIDISLEKLYGDNPNAILTRAHFGKFLLNNGYVKTMKDAFAQYLNTDSRYYVPRKYIDAKDAIDLIHQAGGVSILAHPLLYKLDLIQIKSMVSDLKDAGLVGLEALYSGNTGMDESYLRGIANHYHLLISGGTDYHGANKPQLELGTGKGNMHIPYRILEDLENFNKNRAVNES